MDLLCLGNHEPNTRVAMPFLENGGECHVSPSPVGNRERIVKSRLNRAQVVVFRKCDAIFNSVPKVIYNSHYGNGVPTMLTS